MLLISAAATAQSGAGAHRSGAYQVAQTGAAATTPAESGAPPQAAPAKKAPAPPPAAQPAQPAQPAPAPQAKQPAEKSETKSAEQSTVRSAGEATGSRPSGSRRTRRNRENEDAYGESRDAGQGAVVTITAGSDEEQTSARGDCDCPTAKNPLEDAVEKAVEKKIEPLEELIRETGEKGPGPMPIIGSIGYLVGLVGLFAYFKSRSNNSAK